MLTKLSDGGRKKVNNSSLTPCIQRTLNERKFLSFKYFNRNGQKSSRKIEPYCLVLKEVNWYLQGYCTLKQDFRIFKLSRISNLEILDEIFIPREFDNKSLGAWDYIERNIITVKLLVDESLRDRMIEYCGAENIEYYDNNKLIVNFPFVEDEFGYNLLLGFGDKCECLEPARVRDEMIRRIKNLLRVYNY